MRDTAKFSKSSKQAITPKSNQEAIPHAFALIFIIGKARCFAARVLNAKSRNEKQKRHPQSPTKAMKAEYLLRVDGAVVHQYRGLWALVGRLARLAVWCFEARGTEWC